MKKKCKALEIFGFETLRDYGKRVFLIEGQMPRKSNSRRMVFNRKTKKPMFIKSKDAIDWMDRAIVVMKTLEDKSFTKPCGMRAWVFYRSRRSDLSVELLKDAMQKAGVVKNDRLIEYEENRVFVDKERPRVIVEIWEMAERLSPPNDPSKEMPLCHIL